MAGKGKVHFLTAYIEFLLDEGIKSEEYYLGDASRFLRFLLARVEEGDIKAFVEHTSPSYQKRLRQSLRKFYVFAQKELKITNTALEQV
ncbi:MAG: hypothetical protein GX354_10600 [Firmicutes bacterium]|jgi:hypothetical protein|nr:hypothetical protein [Bacillota bacterium]